MITNLTILNANQLGSEEETNSNFKDVFADDEVEDEFSSLLPEQELEELEVVPEKRIEGGATLYTASDNIGMLFILPAIGLFFLIIFGVLVCTLGKSVTRENQEHIPADEETFWDRWIKTPSTQRTCYKISLVSFILMTAAFSICCFHNVGEMLK